MLKLDVRCVRLVCLGYDLIPKHASHHDIALFRRVHLVAALASQIKSNFGKSFDFRGRVERRIDRTLLTVLQGDNFLGFAKVGATGQLT